MRRTLKFTGLLSIIAIGLIPYLLDKTWISIFCSLLHIISVLPKTWCIIAVSLNSLTKTLPGVKNHFSVNTGSLQHARSACKDSKYRKLFRRSIEYVFCSTSIILTVEENMAQNKCFISIYLMNNHHLYLTLLVVTAFVKKGPLLTIMLLTWLALHSWL